FGLESAGDGDFFGLQATGRSPVKHAAFFAAGHAGADGQSTGEQGSAAGGADTGGDIKIGELHAFTGHSIEVGSANAGMTVTTQIAIAEVVGQDNDDVRRAGGGDQGESDEEEQS